MVVRYAPALIGAMLIASISPALAASAEFTASFRWCTKDAQSTTSPVFALSGVPKGTTVLSLYMFDHNASYNHGGGDVPYRGGTKLPCGAIKSGWVGPFPPPGQTHTYEFSVKALDAKGNTLGETRATREFPEN
jgi:phosphatidylethanolamine-binding protein (PEBP) family uncharacterized protein